MDILERLNNVLGEAKQSKVVVVYAGRFQPFHKGHFETFTNVLKEFPHADIYIGTSNKVDLPKSPFNFKEKKQIITKMFGVKSNQVKEIKNPYAPKEILDKYPEDTVYVTVVGKKDGERLGKGKYFDFYAKGDDEMEGYPEKGYIYIAPENQTVYKGKPLSGTVVRETFASASDEDKQGLFKTLYGKFDKKIFDLITSKIKLDESFQLDEGKYDSLKKKGIKLTGKEAHVLANIINTYGRGDRPVADDSSVYSFTHDFVKTVFKNFENSGDFNGGKEELSIKRKLNESAEPLVEGKDIEQVMDTLSNSADTMNKAEFIDFLSSNTKYKKNVLEKTWDAWWDIDPKERDDWSLSPWFFKQFLKRFGVK